MARLINAGMELGSSAARGVSTQVGAYATDGGTVGTALNGPMESTTIRPGGGEFSIKLISTGSTTSTIVWDSTQWAAWSISNTYFVSVAFCFDTMPTAATTDIFGWSTNGGANKVVKIRLTSAGKLQVTDGLSAQIGSDSGATLVANTWYILQSKCKTVAGASDDTIEARIIDTQSYSIETFVSTTVATIATVALQGGSIGIQSNPTAACNMFVDDLIVNDNVGTSNNDYPDPREVIVALRPKSDNTRNGWTDGAGGTTNLFDAINNEPPVGLQIPTATSQVKDATVSATDNLDVNTQTYLEKGIGPNDVITSIGAGANFGTSSTTLTGAVAIVSNPAVTEVTDTTGTLGVGNYPTNWTQCWPSCVPVNLPSVTLGTSPVLRLGKRTSTATVLHCDVAIITVGVIKWRPISSYTATRSPSRAI